MGLQHTPVILIYDDYWLLGKVPTREERVLDVLKDPNTVYVEIAHVQVFRNQSRVASISQGVVAKKKLSLILIPGKKHEAPEKRSLYFMKKRMCHTCVLVPGYTVQGKLHPSRLDNSLLTLTGGVADFFPMTDAKIQGAGIEPLEVPVAIINKSVVAFFSVGASLPHSAQQPPVASEGMQTTHHASNFGTDNAVLGLNDAAKSLCASVE